MTQNEKRLQKQIEDFLRAKNWHVIRTHGNLYQCGLPDDYATHRSYGPRWIEIKLPTRKSNVFTPAQRELFHAWQQNGTGVWVMVAATEYEYQKLFRSPNWTQFLDINKPFYSRRR